MLALARRWSNRIVRRAAKIAHRRVGDDEFLDVVTDLEHLVHAETIEEAGMAAGFAAEKLNAAPSIIPEGAKVLLTSNSKC